MELYRARKYLDNINDINKYEYGNILDRLMINIVNEDKNAFRKARSECLEKRIPPVLSDDVENYVMNAYSKYHNLSNKNGEEKKNKKQIAMPGELLKLKEILLSRISPGKNTFYKHIKNSDIDKCVYRYAAIGMRGQQWRLDSNIVNDFKNAGIAVEAFSSPFNHYTDASGRPLFKYFSAFEEDRIFGSNGSFIIPSNRKKIKEITKGVYANPPFTPFMLEQMSEIMCDISDKNKKTKFYIITPTWIDASWYMRLNKCGFTPRIKTKTVYEMLGERLIPTFTTTLWTKNTSSPF